ncbi:RNA/RNP complex-1-interacting phosphatase-like [Bolinopsis microptera]|uniref:RNA/RNP complex-1-interacting phosphatase-like n=1 Tax=Bolinopsis microptera TaxID=2820187 RepID=UPI003079B7D9
MGKSEIPDRWDKFSPFNKTVRGTCLLAHKTPLQTSFNRNLTPTDLVQSLKDRGMNLKLVIDLSNTDRYYAPNEFVHLGVAHIKVPCTHDKIPSQDQVDRFKELVSSFQQRGSTVIGVHCSYGVNCTGYMIARYLIETLGWSAEDAINEVDLARGHTMERITLIEDLLNRTKNLSRKRKKLYRSTLPLTNVRNKVCNCMGPQQSHLEEIMFN